MRRCCWVRNRALTSSGRLGLLATSQRRTALDATLLTFCPPGPPERTKLHSNSSSGIRIVSLISSIDRSRQPLSLPSPRWGETPPSPPTPLPSGARGETTPHPPPPPPPR